MWETIFQTGGMGVAAFWRKLGHQQYMKQWTSWEIKFFPPPSSLLVPLSYHSFQAAGVIGSLGRKSRVANKVQLPKVRESERFCTGPNFACPVFVMWGHGGLHFRNWPQGHWELALDMGQDARLSIHPHSLNVLIYLFCIVDFVMAQPPWKQGSMDFAPLLRPGHSWQTKGLDKANWEG